MSAYRDRLAFTLAEVIVGIGLAGALVMLMLLLGTMALATDAQANSRQLASAYAEAKLATLSAQVSVRDSAERNSFIHASDGLYSGTGIANKESSNGVTYTLEYKIKTLPTSATSDPLGAKLRQVDLKVSWWEGEQGKPGYGRLSLERTRVIRESSTR